MKRAGGLALALAAVIAAAVPASGQLAPGAVDDGAAWLEYRLSQTVTNGGGVYAGWSDRLTATGRYEIEGRTCWARYVWSYRSPDSDRRGSEDRRVRFDPTTRLYLDRPIDLDEYDEGDDPTLAVWWRIPTTVSPGDTVRILENDFRVVGAIARNPRTRGRDAVLLEARGIGRRDDAYGSFETDWEDRYWFDAETGWFLREERTEHDEGTYDGDLASFDVTTSVEPSAASYLPGTSASYVHENVPASERFGDEVRDRERGILAFLTDHPVLSGVGLLFVGWVGFLLFRRKPKRHDYTGTIAAVGEVIPPEVATLSPFFGETIQHLVRQAQRFGSVFVARNGQGIEGLALPAPAGEAATIFARDTACCEALRQKIGATHFFSEVRHEHAFAARAAAGQHNVTLTGNHAYNVLETHELLKLEPVPADVAYDRRVVRRATEADQPAIIQVADAVYGGSNTAWIEAAAKHGDVILVAVDASAAAGEPIVGFAIVSVVGATARFSGLTVAPGHRGKGLAKELNRARVRIASDLGAERAIVEVAAWNTASLEIARAAGFTKVGSMYVETAASTDTGQKFRRR